MNILGIAGLLIDSASCLIKGDKIVAACEEERYARIKHISMAQSGGLPFESIDACFRIGGISGKEIDHVGYFFQPWREFLSLSRFRLNYSYLSLPTLIYYQIDYLDTLRKQLIVPRLIREKCNNHLKFHWFSHHLSHAASAYYASVFDEAAILVIDARGEIECVTFYHAKGNKIRRLLSYNFPHSLGFFYATLTDFLGFRSNNDEYKVMGLASHGMPTFYDKLKDVIYIKPNGEIRLNFKYFNRYFRGKAYINQRFCSIFGPARKSNEEIKQRHADLAASLQLLLEESAIRMVKHLHNLTGTQNLCLAGGVALNCTLNGRLLSQGPFQNIFLQPACHDAGGALGAALLVKHQVLGLKQRDAVISPYLGEEFSNDEIKNQLDKSKITYEYYSNIAAKCADLLARGNIVGWFQGRAEWGPRALGNRSILADPTRPEMKDRINISVKYREEFRPFAPSVAIEDTSDFFLGVKDSPFMLFVVQVKEAAKKKIPAVVHVNATSRVHTVSKEVNPLYYKLLREFEKIKGVPVLLNTSFNINREPIVNSPTDAIKCFYSTGIDCLVIGNYVVIKNGAGK